MNLAYVVLIALLLLCGWRTSSILANEAPWVRTTGTVPGAVLPFPVFLIVLARHYMGRSSRQADLSPMVQ